MAAEAQAGDSSSFEIPSLEFDFRQSVRGLADFLEAESPHTLIFPGDSSDISRSLCEGAGLLNGKQVVTFPHFDFYGGQYELRQFVRQYVEKTPEGVVVVDEFVSTGLKASVLQNAFLEFGFKKAPIFAFAGNPIHQRTIERMPNLGVGTFNKSVYELLCETAMVVSASRRNPNKPQDVEERLDRVFLSLRKMAKTSIGTNLPRI